MRRELRREIVKMRIRRIVSTKCFKVIILLGIWLAYAKYSPVLFHGPKMVPPVNLKYVVVHLDFKRTNINLDYVQGLLDTLKKLGANGLLMEYEDMFPFEGHLTTLGARSRYSKFELRQFLESAKQKGFEIIPLVQTFGHMEFVLKHKEYINFREDKNHTDSLCPSKPTSRILILDMLAQVINFHNSIAPLKYIHIGCDEVFHISKCNACRRQKLSKQAIYLKHVTAVYDMVKSLSKNTKVLLWDDMLRTIKPNKWQFDYKTPIEPVYWTYSPNFTLNHASLMNYHKTFPNIWIASAYKGAETPTSILPDVRKRFLNHYSWLNAISKYKFGGENHVYNFKGIILTGWSRYNHNKPACDLLPASIPSLFVNLLLIQEFKSGEIKHEDVMDPSKLYSKYIDSKLEKALPCQVAELQFDDSNRELDIDNIFLHQCDFEGNLLYLTLKSYSMLNASIDGGKSLIVTNMKLSKTDWCEYMSNSIKFLEKDMTENMKEYYINEFVSDYVLRKILPLKVALNPCYV